MNHRLHIEVVQHRQSRASKDYIKSLVHPFLANLTVLTPGVTLRGGDLPESSELKENVEAITFCDVEHPDGTDLLMVDTELLYHVFKLEAFGAATETMTDSNTGEEFVVAEILSLPAQELHGLWESLLFESRLKEDTVHFVETAFEFAEHGVDPNVVGWNRVVLLHGPPGTGKTSLCRALAQKLSVRLAERFPRARLIEINAHGLFSKWFAESGKLVARVFERVRDITADPRLLACVLVDEVESLAHARRAALSGLEPSDSIRAVNALLTELDRLKRCPNVLVLTTSNVTGAIDVAFADRADIKRHVGPPTARAAYEILRGCCAELMLRGCVKTHERVFALSTLKSSSWKSSAAAESSLQLWEVARAAAAARLSGRALRRLPFLARALHLSSAPGTVPELRAFVAALQASLDSHLRDAEDFRSDDAGPDSLRGPEVPRGDPFSGAD